MSYMKILAVGLLAALLAACPSSPQIPDPEPTDTTYGDSGASTGGMDDNGLGAGEFIDDPSAGDRTPGETNFIQFPLPPKLQEGAVITSNTTTGGLQNGRSYGVITRADANQIHVGESFTNVQVDVDTDSIRFGFVDPETAVFTPARHNLRPGDLVWYFDNNRNHPGNFIDLTCRADHVAFPCMFNSSEVGPNLDWSSFGRVLVTICEYRIFEDIEPGQLIILKRHFYFHRISSISFSQRLSHDYILAKVNFFAGNKRIERQRKTGSFKS